jgi:hypothetical protein
MKIKKIVACLIVFTCTEMYCAENNVVNFGSAKDKEGSKNYPSGLAETIRIAGALGVQSMVTAGCVAGIESFKNYVNSDSSDPMKFERRARILVGCAGFYYGYYVYRNGKKMVKNFAENSKKIPLSGWMFIGSVVMASGIAAGAGAMLGQKFALSFQS